MPSFLTSIGYHDGNFEVEIVAPIHSKTKKEAESVGSDSALHIALLDNEKIVINKDLIIRKEDRSKYQFRVYRGEWKPMVSYKDYEPISWEEAIEYLVSNNVAFPFKLESYYFGVYKYGENQLLSDLEGRSYNAVRALKFV